jgi:hypothetical protein
VDALTLGQQSYRAKGYNDPKWRPDTSRGAENRACEDGRGYSKTRRKPLKAAPTNLEPTVSKFVGIYHEFA